MKPKVNRKGIIDNPSPYDLCGTTPNALAPLLPFVDANQIVWESACGKMPLANAMQDNGFAVWATDIDRGLDFNFFEYEAPFTHYTQITNPPFSIKYHWLKRSYELGQPFALLLPLETLGAQTAIKLFQQHGMELIVLDRRVNFAMPNAAEKGPNWKSSAQFPVAWFTHGLNIGSPLTYGHLPTDPQQVTL